MKKNTAKTYFIEQLKSSLNWIFPVGLIITTFLILFFSISEHVANIKTAVMHSEFEIQRLQDRLAYYDNNRIHDASIPANTTNNNKPLVRLQTGIRNIIPGFQKLQISNNKMFWGYTFEPAFSETNPSVATYTLVKEDLGMNTLILSYTLEDVTKSPQIFDLFEYSDAKKQIISLEDGKAYNQILVLYNKKAVLYYDFKAKYTLEDTLQLLDRTGSVPADIRDSVIKDVLKK